MRRKILCAAVGGLLLAAACGGDPFSSLEEEGDFGPQRTDVGSAAGATQAVHGALGLAGIVGASEVDASSVGAMGQLSSIALQIVSEALFDFEDLGWPVKEESALADLRLAAAWGAHWAEFPDCVEQGDAEVRFRDCELIVGDTTTSMSGVIEVAGDRLLADIDIDTTVRFDDRSQQMSSSIAADLRISDAHIEGRVDTVTTASFSGVGSARQTSATIYAVELEDGCATGGELRVGVEQRASAGGESQTLRAIGRAEFGPECGEVRVYARLD
jgi:hypothetical protein